MKKRSKYLFIFSILLSVLFLVRVIHAATSRITVDAGSGTGTAGGSVSVKALLRESVGGPVSVGEGAQFLVRTPRSGDRCDTNPAPSDSQGYVYGTCYADQAGTITFYARSLNNGDESNDAIITFISGPTPTNTPTTTLTPTPSTKKTLSPTEEATPTEEPVEDEDAPTPTPEEKTAGFFSNPLSIIGLLIVLIFLGAGGFILWKERKFPFNKFQLKKIEPKSSQNTQKPPTT